MQGLYVQRARNVCIRVEEAQWVDRRSSAGDRVQEGDSCREKAVAMLGWMICCSSQNSTRVNPGWIKEPAIKLHLCITHTSHLCAELQKLTVIYTKSVFISLYQHQPSACVCWGFFSSGKLYQIFLLIFSLNRPAFYLRYSSQLVLCEQGDGEICLYFPLPPEISLPCNGDSLGQSTCAFHLIPLIYHRLSLRNRRISLSATVAPQFAPANNNKEKPRANVLVLKGKVGDYRTINISLFTTTLVQQPFFFSLLRTGSRPTSIPDG